MTGEPGFKEPIDGRRRRAPEQVVRKLREATGFFREQQALPGAQAS
jgi:hypothetical protein